MPLRRVIRARWAAAARPCRSSQPPGRSPSPSRRPGSSPLSRSRSPAAPAPAGPAAANPASRRPAAPAGHMPSVDFRPTARMPLPVKALRIGRTPDNDLVLPDLDVSRHHAELRRSPNGAYEIVDLGSHNGTFVNGKRVSSAVLSETDHRQHRPLDVPAGRRRTAAVRRRGRGHLQRAGPGRDGGRRQGAARPRDVPDPGEVPARRHRAQWRGQVDAARRADRDASRGHRHRAVRQPRPVPGLRRAPLPDRPGAAGKRAAHPADGPARAAVLRRAPFPGRHHGQRAGRPGRRGDGRARPDQARQHARRPALRRPAQAGQHRPGTADQAVAAVPRRAHLRPGPRPGQVRHGADAGPGPRRPDRHRGHAQRPQPGPVRPAAGPGPRRADRVLRPADRWARLLRQDPVGRRVPGVRPVPGPRLGRRVRRLAGLRPVRAGPAVQAAAAAGPAADRRRGGKPARRAAADDHADPPVRPGAVRRPRFPAVHGRCCRSSSAC